MCPPKFHALEAWSFGTLRVARNFKVELIGRSLGYGHWSLLFGQNYLVRSMALPNVPILMCYLATDPSHKLNMDWNL